MPMLTGPQIKPFQQALLSAFTRDSLTQMLSTELNKQFEQLVKDTDFDYQVFQLIDRANREGWAYKLLLVAASYNPGNPDLQAYAASLNLAAVGTPPTTSALESLIQKNNSYLDAALFRTRQGWVETAVCRIKIDGTPAGTGFLVGPGTVLTNYHVLPQVISGAVASCRRHLPVRLQAAPGRPAGQPGHRGRPRRRRHVADRRHAAHGPGAGRRVQDGAPRPRRTRLRPAAARAGDRHRGAGRGDARHRQEQRRPAARLARLYDRLQFSRPTARSGSCSIPRPCRSSWRWPPNAVEQLNQNKTRVTYRTNTEPGSSGSPVFDQNWNLVALHHMGDPDWSTLTHNEGIPVASIQNYLKAKNLHSNLGQQK